ncbi:MAG TPA: hypothetical protein VN361_12030 [Oxalicibacterium sp.]|nr:hypothetical protein [Oxalicibacterium sp.]
MDNNDHKRQQLISDLFGLERTREASGTNHVHSWRRLADHLTPLIGETGFSALYGRAVRLVQAQYTWMALEQLSPSIDSLFGHLQSRLSSVDEAHAAEANMALLDTFSKLLSGLIGNALTIRLLNAAWSQESHQGNQRSRSK